jgi:hypothetical protein
VIEEQRREGGDAGETAAIEAVEHAGDLNDVGRLEPAFVTAVERIAFGMDAGEQVLYAPGSLGAGCGLARLCLIEHGPVIRLKHPCSTIGLVAGDLLEMAEMAKLEAGPVGRLGTGHIDGHGTLDAAAQDRLAGRARAAELLGHGKDLQAEPRRLVLEDTGVTLDRIEVDHIGIGRDLALAVKFLRCFDEAWIAPAQDVEKHSILLSGTFRAATRRLRQE